MYKEIYKNVNGGDLEGYSVSATDENYINFLNDNINDKKIFNSIVDFIKNKDFDNIIIIKNINVEEDFRGEGIGKSLLEDSIEDAKIVFLISDKYESQLKDFILDKFYENADFDKIYETSAGNLMCYPSEVAVEINEVILKNKKSKIKLVS